VRLTGLSSSELLAALDTLERRGVIRGAGGANYDFVHDLVRQAAYRQMSEPRRRVVHLQIARSLAALPDDDGAWAGDVAHHAALGGDHDAAARACVRAAERCLRLFAHGEASELVARGLAHARQLPRDARVRLEIAFLGKQARNPLSRRLRAQEIGTALSRVVREAQDAGLELEAAQGLYARSIVEYTEGKLEAAYETTVEAASRHRASDPGADPVTTAEQMGNMARCLIFVEKDVAHAETLLAQAAALVGPRAGELPQLSWATGVLLHYMGRHEAATVALERTLALARRTEARWEECDCLTRMGLIAVENGDNDVAIARSETLMPIVRRMGEGSDVAAADAVLALARYALGAPGAGEEVEHAIATLREIDAKGMLAGTLNLAAETDLRAGRADRARARAEEALAAAGAVERWSQVTLARAVLARLALAAGDREAARAAMAPVAAHLTAHLGISDRARRAAAAVAAALDARETPTM
jgi:tetratricopeptide (TPR) repeat protein